MLAAYVFDTRQPFSRIFSAKHTVIGPVALAFLGLSSEGSAWSGDSILLASYGDLRPEAGVLVTTGFLAGLDSEGRSDLNARSARLISLLSCLNLHLPDAHSFATVDTSRLADLSSYARETLPCASCHLHYEGFAATYQGLGQGSTFTDWKTYTAPSSLKTTYYVGHSYSGLVELGKKMGDDPRIHQCELQRLIGSLLARPYTFRYDVKYLMAALDLFSENELDLFAALEFLLDSSLYRADILSASAPTDDAEVHPGARFLNREEWQGILTDLNERTASLEFSVNLDPGNEDVFDQKFRIPGGPYFHAANRIARQAAAIIIDDELADSTSAVARRLLGMIPDGSGGGALEAAIRTQLQVLWKRLTGLSVEAKSDRIDALYSLWSGVSEGLSTDAGKVRDAWEAVLVGIFLSPEFLTF